MKKYNYLLLVCFLTGCSTYPASLYSHSVSNIHAMKAKAEAKPISVKLNEFTVSGNIQQEITCRGAGPVVPSPGKTYEKYIRDAMYDELVLAGIYKDNAAITIDGRLEAIDFSSGVTDAEWSINLIIKSSNGHTASLFERFQFGSSFEGNSACRNTANAFAPAVQSLLSKFVNHPDFYKLVSNDK